MLKAYKYRIYPNHEQEKKLVQNMGCARFIYNKALAERIKFYNETGKGLSYLSQQNSLPKLKKEFEWLKESQAQSLQMSLRNLDIAFKNFFKKSAKFPNFKKKSDKQSIQFPQNVKIYWEKNSISIPKCSEVKTVLSRKFDGDIKTCTVSKTPTGKFFISILVDDKKDLPKKQRVDSKTSIGIDLGIKDFATFSSGEKIANPKYLNKSLAKLKVLQRKASRKKKGSQNKKKANLKVALIHERITNQRNDFLHKLSSKIISENQTVIVEGLNIKGMVKNHKLARHISDVSWGKFVSMLEYKANWNGKNLIKINRFDPSSKTCSKCGSINKALKLSDREWTCSLCKSFHDRDINAAINIKKFGLKKIKTGKELPLEPELLSNTDNNITKASDDNSKEIPKRD